MNGAKPVAGGSQTSKVEASASVDQGEIDTLMRRFFVQGRTEVADPSDGDGLSLGGRDGAPRRDFDMATELLDRASEAFDLLINRCQTLEQDLEGERQRGQTRAAEQGETIEQWKRLASGLKGQLDASDQACAALKDRSDAAEARALAAERRVVALERASAQAAAHAATSDQLSTRLHDKVVAAFGIGSRAHPVLEAVATRSAADEA